MGIRAAPLMLSALMLYGSRLTHIASKMQEEEGATTSPFLQVKTTKQLDLLASKIEVSISCEVERSARQATTLSVILSCGRNV